MFLVWEAREDGALAPCMRLKTTTKFDYYAPIHFISKALRTSNSAKQVSCVPPALQYKLCLPTSLDRFSLLVIGELIRYFKFYHSGQHHLTGYLKPSAPRSLPMNWWELGSNVCLQAILWVMTRGRHLPAPSGSISFSCFWPTQVNEKNDSWTVSTLSYVCTIWWQTHSLPKWSVPCPSLYFELHGKAGLVQFPVCAKIPVCPV